MGPLEWLSSLLAVIRQIVNLIRAIISKDLSRCVHPILRDADVLQHYDGATAFNGRHRTRVLKNPPTPMRLNFDLYRRQLGDDQTYFNFGIIVAPYSRESLKSPRMQVQFPNIDGVAVNATANPGDQPWTSVLANQVYAFSFPSVINPGESYSGTGVLRVAFPRRGTYYVRLVITGENMNMVERTLPVILW